MVAAGELLLVNVGALVGSAEPGFAVLHFDENTLTWYDVDGDVVRQQTPVPLFTQ